MKFNVAVQNGNASVTDAATGQPVDWIDSVDVVLAANAAPILYLGTTNFTASFQAGPAAAPAVPVTPAPTPTPAS